MRSIPKPTDREEWLEARHPFWNASDAATLLDRHPFKTLQDVISSKLTECNLDEPENTAMRRGRHLEHAIASWYEDETGIVLFEPSSMYVTGHVCATLDRRIVDDESRAIEIKSTKKTVAEPEPYWVDQVQLQMYAADLVAVHIVAMDATQELQTFTVERDDDLISEMIAKLTPIMEAIHRNEWPEENPTASKPRKESGASVELDTDTLEAVSELEELRTQIRSLQASEEQTKKLITQRLGDASVGMFEGRNVVRKAFSTRRSVDLSRLRNDHPSICENYEQSKSFAVLRVLR